MLGPSARGIGMVDAEVSDAELRRLTRGGVRGARFLMVPGGMLSWHELEPLAARIQQVGWHVNLQLDGHELAERADLIARLPGQIIIDHLGMFGRPVSLDHPSVLALLHLLESGRVWVKLSAPYAGGGMGGPPYPAAGVLARALVHHAPERLMWGSNWPHPFTTQVRGLPGRGRRHATGPAAKLGGGRQCAPPHPGRQPQRRCSKPTLYWSKLKGLSGWGVVLKKVHAVRVTSLDVARLAGVSQSAVSRALTPGASISAAMKRRVTEAAEELGYTPNVFARSLITPALRHHPAL